METTANKETYEDVIKALRSGLVPLVGTDRILVGNKAELDEIDQQLDRVAGNKSDFKFICGCYGSGKTFLCSCIKEMAWEKNFAVSVVTVSQESPLNKLDIVYNKIIDGLRTDENRFSCAFTDILEAWLFNIQQKVMNLNDIDLTKKVTLERLVSENIRSQLSSDIVKIGIARAIEEFYVAKLYNNTQKANIALGWLKGEKTITASVSKSINLNKGIDKQNALDFLKALLHIVRLSGYSGLVVIFDEVETLQRLNSTQRTESYQNIRLFLDKIAENTEYQSCYFLFTGNESLFNDKVQGIPSYKPLYDRISYIDTITKNLRFFLKIYG